MRANTYTLLALLFCAAATVGFSQTVVINEFLASNNGSLADEAGEFDDWVELYNPGAVPADIGGMYLTDDLAQPTLWQIPANDPAATTIPPGGFLLLWFDKQPAQGILHVNAKLSGDGEALGLFAADGSTMLDGLTFGAQNADVSYGRMSDGSTDFQHFTTPTPGASNLAAIGGRAAAPVASQGGGFFSGTVGVAFSSATSGAKIYFTTDGSVPTEASALYAAPLVLSQNTALRARAFAAGLDASDVTTHTYFLETTHTFPVVALSFEPGDFFDPATGIYPNYLENWERPAHVEMFETDGSTAFRQAGTAEIHGTSSAEYLQKSLKIEAADGQFPYPIFPDLELPSYKTFLLRNSGQDWNITLFHDAFVTSLVGDLSDVGEVIEPPRLYLQGFRPGIAYLNGQYWGIHNLREHATERYVEAHFGLDESQIDFLENDAEARAGDFDRWNFLLTFLDANHFGDDDRFTQLGTFFDLPHFLDYNLLNIVADNVDWPGNNVRRWRERSNDAQWRFLTYDLDLSFGLYDLEPDTALWNTGDASANALLRALDSTKVDWPNPFWMTLPFRKSMENATFRRDFINRSADWLNILFDPARVNARLDQFVATYQPEVQRHFERWSPGWFPWADNVEVLRRFANDRPQFMRQHVLDVFEETNGTALVTLQTAPPGGGDLYFSTLRLAADLLPWSGMYFTEVGIPLRASPAPGMVFSHWSLPSLGDEPSTQLHLSADETVTAFFAKGSTAMDAIIINEINYNSPDQPNSGDWVELFNPHPHPVDLSGWVLGDEDGGYFSLRGGTVLESGAFLVLAEKVADFNAVYPLTVNVTGNFGEGLRRFKLDNGGEFILLKNADLLVIDSVRYDDELPWSLDADGTGSTLQLIDWQLDNVLASSWKASVPSPGLPNVEAQQSQIIDFQPISNKIPNSLPFEVFAVATSGLPVTLAVVTGPATISGNVVTLTGEEGAVVLSAKQQGDALWQTAPPVYRSFQVQKPQAYCELESAFPWHEWIDRVQFGAIDHLSFKTPYGDYTHLATDAPIGGSLPLRVSPAYSWEVFEEYFRAWLDFNLDGDFDDPGELVLETYGTGSVSAEVFIPAGVSPGVSRLRVAMQRDSFPVLCSGIAAGEVEDYTVIFSQDGSFAPPHEGDKFNLVINPNPVQTTLLTQFSIEQPGVVYLTLANANGAALRKEEFHLQSGNHQVELDVSELAGGRYSVSLKREGKGVASRAFVKM